LDRNGLSVSPETACQFEPKSPVGNSEICNPWRYLQQFEGDQSAAERQDHQRSPEPLEEVDHPQLFSVVSEAW
jgi:hypothetical protein